MRRGFTLVEILIALVIMALVSSGVLAVFQYQNRDASTKRDVAEMNLMAKGTMEELSRNIRMAGGALPPGIGGLKVYGSGAERVKVALNRNDGVDTMATPSQFNNSSQSLSCCGSYQKFLVLPVKHVAGVFTDSGYVITDVRVPPVGAPNGTAPSKDTMIVLKILKLVASGSAVTVNGTSISPPFVIADGTWFGSNWNWANSVQTSVSTLVYAMDSVLYWMSNDTVYRKIDRNLQGAYAVGVDSLHLQYQDPTGVWADSLTAAGAGTIVMAKIRLRVRTRHADPVLLRTNPSSLGLHYQTVQSEVSLRNSSTLVNQ
ncbi:MAG TPA: type II secretion system protein [Fibrobacteria bacterium]|nr:type II secretion system protein [Fibrobacteria bacterium]